MRILVVNYEFPPVGGGGGRIAADLCRMLARRGHELRVLTSWVAPLPKVEEHDGYTIRRSFAFRRRPERCTIPEMAAYVLMHAWPGQRLVRRWQPDLLHVHFAVPSGAVAYAATRCSRVPYVITAHLGDVPGGVPAQTDRAFRWLKPFTKPIWRRAAAVTAVSEFTRDLAVQAYDVPVTVIHNGIEMAACQPGPVEPHDPPRLAFVGRFNAQKNLPFLVALLARCGDLPWTMDFIGDGPERPAIETQISRLGLRDRVHFHGWVPEEQVAQVLRGADILLLPSLSEGLSLAGVNALAHGLAIVASRIAGNRDLVADGCNGRLCELNNLDEFEMALRELLTAPAVLRHMKAESRIRAQRFDLETITDQYEEIFRGVVR